MIARALKIAEKYLNNHPHDGKTATIQLSFEFNQDVSGHETDLLIHEVKNLDTIVHNSQLLNNFGHMEIGRLLQQIQIKAPQEGKTVVQAWQDAGHKSTSA